MKPNGTMKRTILAATCGLSLLSGLGALAGCTGAAGVGVGAGAGAAGAPNMQTLYTVGRVWEYTSSSNAGGQNVTDTIKQEVTEIKDNKATIKVTTKAGTSTSTVDLADKDALTKAGMAGQGQLPPGMTMNTGAPSNESVTVPAGTYPCVKTTTTSNFSQSGMTMDSTSDVWVNAGVGLVKLVSTTKTTLPAGMPSMPNMPGMGEIKTTMELKSFK